MIRSVPQFQTLPPAFVPHYAMLVNHSLPFSRTASSPGAKHYAFHPRGYNLPQELKLFESCEAKKGPNALWIVKPACNSCGRGTPPPSALLLFSSSALFCYCFVTLLVSSFAALFLLLSFVFRTNLPPFCLSRHRSAEHAGGIMTPSFPFFANTCFVPLASLADDESCCLNLPFCVCVATLLLLIVSLKVLNFEMEKLADMDKKPGKTRK